MGVGRKVPRQEPRDRIGITRHGNPTHAPRHGAAVSPFLPISLGERRAGKRPRAATAHDDPSPVHSQGRAASPGSFS